MEDKEREEPCEVPARRFLARMTPSWFNPGIATFPPKKAALDFPSVSCRLEGGGGQIGLVLDGDCEGSCKPSEGHLAGQASQKSFENNLDAPGGAVWFGKRNQVVVSWDGGRGALGPHPYSLPRV